MDKSRNLEANRAWVWRLYCRLNRLRRFQAYRAAWIDVTNFINEISLLAEQIELYIGRGVVDLDLVLIILATMLSRRTTFCRTYWTAGLKPTTRTMRGFVTLHFGFNTTQGFTT
jgi:hypothetical protein